MSGFKSLRTLNLTSKTKNVAEGRKCTKTRNWNHYWIKIRVKRRKNNTTDNTSNKSIKLKSYENKEKSEYFNIHSHGKIYLNRRFMHVFQYPLDCT